MEWILILLVYAGPMSRSDSVALTSVPGFSARAECETAGRLSEGLTRATAKQTRWVCVQRGKK